MALVVGRDVDLPVAVAGSTGVIADEGRPGLRRGRQRVREQGQEQQRGGEYCDRNLFAAQRGENG
ncbi:MAG TPA: hypothetical protein VKH18_02695 [Terriglobales bacterium]|nr:hypothetical protein [Terriglobales bacterium]